MNEILSSDEFMLVAQYYHGRVATRSQVPLINHIFEGLQVMKYIGAAPRAMRAYCLHPLMQDDELIKDNFDKLCKRLDTDVVALSVEYRSKANAWLSDKVLVMANGSCLISGLPDPGPLIDVKHMLIADKVQNYKDFVIYHKATHSRSQELDAYFKAWFRVLGISDTTLADLIADLTLKTES